MIKALQALLHSGLPVYHTALGAFHTKLEKATAVLLPLNTIQLLDAVIEHEETTPFKINTAGTAAVSTDIYWNEDMSKCPLGVTVFLLGEGGVAACSSYDGDSFWIGWFPALKRRPKPEADPEPTLELAEPLEKLGQELEALGYDLDQLDRDSPYYTNPYA